VGVTTALLDVVEQYLDAVPRVGARAEDHGPLTLFVRESAGYPLYARPRRGHGDTVTARDVALVCARQHDLGVPETIEFVHEIAPSVRDAARAAGLHVTEHPLLVLDVLADVPTPRGTRIRLLDAGDSDAAIAAAQAVARLGFSSPGTGVGQVGAAELAAATAEVSLAEIAATRERVRRGLTVTAVALRGDRVVGVGSHQPWHGVSEIVGVATMPAARRRGVGAAVTRLLADDARAQGCGTVFLSAGNRDVARLYERVGFRRVATSCIAQAC
jgi:ribosomal protein S18 acetylase RimI-like enzyme